MLNGQLLCTINLVIHQESESYELIGEKTNQNLQLNKHFFVVITNNQNLIRIRLKFLPIAQIIKNLSHQATQD